MSLDATDCPIQEPSPFDRKWYSHKINGPGVRYEVGICIRTGRIVWVSGGVPCGDWPDLKLARFGYLAHVRQGEVTIADKGYRDRGFFKWPEDDDPMNTIIKRILARHETVNKRLKVFEVLNQPFRHPRYRHPQCMHAVANVVQMMLQNGEPLFSVQPV